MAGSLNKVFLIGNLGADPEVRQAQSGREIVTFSMATSESWKDKQTGERKDRTQWHRIVIFNEGLGKIAQNLLKKGTKVYIEGQLQTRKYNDSSGQEKWTTEVVLQGYKGELTVLDKKRQDEGYTSSRNENTENESSDLSSEKFENTSGSGDDISKMEDDIPF